MGITKRESLLNKDPRYVLFGPIENANGNHLIKLFYIP